MLSPLKKMSNPKPENIVRLLYAALNSLSRFDTPEEIRIDAESDEGYMGCEYEESIEMAYDNMINMAKQAVEHPDVKDFISKLDPTS